MPLAGSRGMKGMSVQSPAGTGMKTRSGAAQRERSVNLVACARAIPYCTPLAFEDLEHFERKSILSPFHRAMYDFKGFMR